MYFFRNSFILPDIMGFKRAVNQCSGWAEHCIRGRTEPLKLNITIFYGIHVNVNTKYKKIEPAVSFSLCSTVPVCGSPWFTNTYQGPGVEGDPVLTVHLGLLGQREVGLEACARPDYQSCHLAFQGVKFSKVIKKVY